MKKSIIIKIIAILATLTAGVTVPMYSNMENNHKFVKNQESATIAVPSIKDKENLENTKDNQNIMDKETTDNAMSMDNMVVDNQGQSGETMPEETIKNHDEYVTGNLQEVTAVNEYMETVTNNHYNKVEVITKKVCTQTVNPSILGNNKPGTTEKQTTEKQTPKHEVTTTKVNNDNVSSNTYVQQVVDLVNKERTKKGLNKLTLDTNLQKAAQIRAKEIETSFSHTRPNGSNFSTVLSELNISYRGSGENIAWGQASPEAVMDAWMNSSGHRANIMNSSFTKIGVGYYQNSAGRKYWSQLFTY